MSCVLYAAGLLALLGALAAMDRAIGLPGRLGSTYQTMVSI
jgi:hypothetical protein